jgi:chromosome segregation ATPase
VSKQQADHPRREVTDDDIAVIDKAINAHEGLGLFLYTTRRILGEVGKLDQVYRGTKQAIEQVQAEGANIARQLEYEKAKLAEVQAQEVEKRKELAALTAAVAEKERMLNAFSAQIDKITGKAA